MFTDREPPGRLAGAKQSLLTGPPLGSRAHEMRRPTGDDRKRSFLPNGKPWPFHPGTEEDIPSPEGDPCPPAGPRGHGSESADPSPPSETESQYRRRDRSMLGIDRSTVRGWEQRGHRPGPRLHARLAEVLDLPPANADAGAPSEASGRQLTRCSAVSQLRVASQHPVLTYGPQLPARPRATLACRDSRLWRSGWPPRRRGSCPGSRDRRLSCPT